MLFNFIEPKFIALDEWSPKPNSSKCFKTKIYIIKNEHDQIGVTYLNIFQQCLRASFGCYKNTHLSSFSAKELRVSCPSELMDMFSSIEHVLNMRSLNVLGDQKMPVAQKVKEMSTCEDPNREAFEDL